MGLIERNEAIDALEEHRKLFCSDNTPRAFSLLSRDTKARVDEIDNAIATIQNLRAAEPDLPNSYARSVAVWLLHYAIKCYKLHGCYTPYEIVNWVLNDWRKENGLD